MYSEDKTVAGAQKIMLEILKVVHRICEEHQIRYFLDGGTLLGAIRHGGFIPWDDDMDISMPREDYERFLQLAPKYLPQDMMLQTTEIEPASKFPFAKVRKNGTVLLEFEEDGTEAYHHGIYIDIFPVDYYKHEWFLRWMSWADRVRSRRTKYPRGSWKRLLVTIYTHYLLFLPIELSLFVRRYFINHKEYFRDKNADYMTFALEWNEIYTTRTKEILPVKYAENVFEGCGFYLPADPHKHLTGSFGPDYMQIPPKEKQRTHAKEIRLHVD
ncbi:MAG: LicD family protein [Acidaminococcaceae bacterium]|nr:LicD family protein [Acidaminococcaceae bacterium]